MESSLKQTSSEHENTLTEKLALAAELKLVTARMQETQSARDEEVSLLQTKLAHDRKTALALATTLEDERDDLLLKVDTAVQKIVCLKRAALPAPTSSVAILTDACDASAHESVVKRMLELDLEHDQLQKEFKEQTRKLDKVSVENRSLLQSNHKQKLQVCFCLLSLIESLQILSTWSI